MMFYHRRCGSQVFLNLAGAFDVYAVIGLSSSRLSAGACEISIKSSGEIPAKFVCRSCNTPVDPADIYILCNYCGERVSLPETRLVKGSGGLYCRHHAESLSEQNGRRMVNFLELLESPIKLSSR